MLLITEILLALLVSVLIAQFIRQRWAMRSLPPGPTPLPFLGNLWALNFEVDHNTLIQMAKTYGNIFTIWLGGEPAIVLNGYKSVRDALTSHSEEISGRPRIAITEALNTSKGIVFSNGPIWKQQRRFGMMSMRNLGLGKKSLESHIQDVAQQLLDSFSAEKGKPMDPTPTMINSVANVICSVVFGHCFSIDDATFKQLIYATDLVVNTRKHVWSRLYDAFPFLMRRLPLFEPEAFVEWKKVLGYIRKEIRIHQENLSDEPRDLIDCYLKQISQTTPDNSSIFNENNLTQVVSDLFLAGTETTTTTMRWALLYMVNRPEIQEKIQKELDSVLEDCQNINYEDRNKVPYTNAVIHEIQRFSNIIPVAVPRECVKETTLQGFRIEKGMMLFPNISSALFDPEMWATPQQFNPDHFLDKDGKFVAREAFLPFGAGHRVCFGEQLARTELFIFFTSLLRAFTLRPPEGVKKFNEDYILAGTCQPHPYKICAISR